MGYVKIMNTTSIQFSGLCHFICSTTQKLEVVIRFFFYILANLFKNTRSLKKLFGNFSGIFYGHKMSRSDICVYFTFNVIILVNLICLTFHFQKMIADIPILNEFDWN